MKICWLTSDSYGRLGGIAQYNRDFLSAVAQYDRCKEILVLPRLVTDAVGAMPRKITWLDKGANNKVSYCLALSRYMTRRKQIDLVICGHINLLPLAYLVSAWQDAPLVLVIYGIDAWQPSKNALKNFLVSKVDYVISISQITLDKLAFWSRGLRAKQFIIPNAIDFRTFYPVARDKALATRYGLEGRTVLATMGRMVSTERYKGMDEVLQLMPRLKKRIPNVAYLLIGDGPDRGRLENKVKEAGISTSVVFAGKIPDDERVRHYSLADAYVMPSRGEGFGFVLLEAMACGIPVVASKADGGREAVKGGQLGILVDPSDQEDIERGIFACLERPKGVRPDGLEYFSYECFENRVHEFLNCVNERR